MPPPNTALSRSIPAGAGEPRVLPRPRVYLPVYPRGCGGTASSPTSTGISSGLSPRVRGNPLRRQHDTSTRRSIPAGAGEPSAADVKSPSQTVYPRGCGGTSGVCAYKSFAMGLSPRVRGNLHATPVPAAVRGSIPAGAGEPRTRSTARIRSGVYPRGCGGTSGGCKVGRTPQGLSPRVRGNR